jgi:hypothetical protein
VHTAVAHLYGHSLPAVLLLLLRNRHPVSLAVTDSNSYKHNSYTYSRRYACKASCSAVCCVVHSADAVSTMHNLQRPEGILNSSSTVMQEDACVP